MDGEFLLWLARYFGLLLLIFIPIAIFAAMVPVFQRRHPRFMFWFCRLLGVGMAVAGLEGVIQDWLIHAAMLHSLHVNLTCVISGVLLWCSSRDLKVHPAAPDCTTR